MQIIPSVKKMQEFGLDCALQGKALALVPTMGYLHEGHLQLVDVAKARCPTVAMSIFVNPTQFGPKEDFAKYPRDLARDQKMAEQRGVDLLFCPEAEEMYPPGFQTKVEVERLSQGLCGDFRPGHFRGVTTVVAKLFLITQAKLAVFGEKDFQQLAVIRRMVRDLNIPIEILGVPTVREADGLALSSRNVYLSAEERQEALNLSRALKLANDLRQSGEEDAAKILSEVGKLLRSGKISRVEYAQIVDAEELNPIEQIDRPARLILAVYVGKTRLIDNGPVG